MAEADCRKCIHFVRVEDMPEGLRHDLTVRLAREGKELLGYCKKQNKPVTYYTGKCRFFAKKRARYLALDGRVVEWW